MMLRLLLIRCRTKVALHIAPVIQWRCPCLNLRLSGLAIQGSTIVAFGNTRKGY